MGYVCEILYFDPQIPRNDQIRQHVRWSFTTLLLSTGTNYSAVSVSIASRYQQVTHICFFIYIFLVTLSLNYRPVITALLAGTYS